jgi:hypothetical protein
MELFVETFIISLYICIQLCYTYFSIERLMRAREFYTRRNLVAPSGD